MPINSSQSRPFNIGDATIIVALTAIGLWGVRIIYHLYSLSNLDFFTIFFLGMPILMALTLGFLIIRLRSPRPNRRRLMRQPGFVACITIAIQIQPFSPHSLSLNYYTHQRALLKNLLLFYCHMTW